MLRVPTLPAFLGLCATTACFNPPDTPLTGETTAGETTSEPDTTTSSTTLGMTTVIDPDTTVGPTTDPTETTTTTGGEPEIEVSIGGRAVPSGGAFDLVDTVAVGEAGTAVEVTIENVGTANLLIGGVLATGPDSPHVSIAQGSLAASLAPGESSSFTATFTPHNGGHKQLQLVIANDDDDESPYGLVLRGHTTENTYRLLAPTGQPAPRFNATLADLGDGRLLMFGGRDATGAFLNDTWFFEVEADTWTQIFPPMAPSPRNAHSMALAEPGTVILFGGSGLVGGGALGDTWAFDVTAETWMPLAPPTIPTPRFQQEMAAIGNARVLMFGGRATSGGNENAETWMYDHGTGTWTNMAPAGAPTPSAAFAFSFDGADTVTRFGGFLNSDPIDQTWNYTISTNTWAAAMTMGSPGARAVLSGEYLEAGQMIVFSGKLDGCCIDPTGGTFAYDRAAGTWATITPPGEPSPRFNYAMTRVAGNKTIFFGGLLQNVGVGTAQGQTWEYVGPRP
jgi:hypothetical protein